MRDAHGNLTPAAPFLARAPHPAAASSTAAAAAAAAAAMPAARRSPARASSPLAAGGAVGTDAGPRLSARCSCCDEVPIFEHLLMFLFLLCIGILFLLLLIVISIQMLLGYLLAHLKNAYQLGKEKVLSLV